MGAERLSKVMQKYRTTYIREDGLRFYGEMFAPSTMENPNRIELPRRFMKIGLTVKIRPGDVFRTEGGQYFLVLEDGDSDFDTTVYRVLKLVQVDRKVPWIRIIKITDPVSGLEIGSTPQSMGAIWVTLEEGTQRNDTLNLTQRIFRVYTPNQLKVGDKIGDLTVIEVFIVSGVCVADAK